jgi:hypothetical protein
MVVHMTSLAMCEDHKGAWNSTLLEQHFNVVL